MTTQQPRRFVGRKLGWCGYASILRDLQRAPAASMRLAEKYGVQAVSMRRVLDRLHDLGWVHVQEWRQFKPRGLHVAMYAFGGRPDAPRPANQRSRRADTLTRATLLPELMQVVQMLRLMESEPISKTELAQKVGSQHSNVTRFVNHCHRIGLVRIADWSVRLRGGKRAALYALGGDPDAPKPRPVDRRVIARRSRQARAQRQQHLQLIHATAANGGGWAEAA